MASADDVRSLAQNEWVLWVRNNKLRCVGLLWATGITTSLAFQATRPIPTQLKVIHSRIYAQALTVGALLGAAGIELFVPPEKVIDAHDDKIAYHGPEKVRR